MNREAGKGSKARPFSVNLKEFDNNWDNIFKKKKPVKLTNPLNHDVWLCEDFGDVRNVDGVEYVTVYKEETPGRTHLMRKDALRP
jgi:hypothetical protein